MKIKAPNGVLTVDILSVLLILSIVLIPSTPARVILGLPFLLFFPGYTLIAALFANENRIEGLERVALSAGMSIAIAGLIGFGLNYTPWGIRLEPVLYSIAAFIFVTSAIALARRRLVLGRSEFTTELALRVPGWEGNTLNKTLTIVLFVAIFGALGVLAYTVAVPKVGEKFTEFYILGINGKAADYPTEFTLDNGKVTEVRYGDGTVDSASGFGKVRLGIVNHEQQPVTYTVRVAIDGEAADVNVGGVTYILGFPVEVPQGQKWEESVGILPRHIGDRQKVEFWLFKGTEDTPENSLHFWIMVK